MKNSESCRRQIHAAAAFGLATICGSCGDDVRLPELSVQFEPLGIIGRAELGSAGDTVLQMPAYIRISPTGKVVTLDTGRKAALLFGLTGQRIATLGRSGRGPGELRTPLGFDVGKDGTVWIADVGNGKLLGYRNEVLSAEFMLEHQPMGVVALNDTTLWVGGNLINSLYRAYTTEGKYLRSAGIPIATGRSEFRLNQGVGVQGARECSVARVYFYRAFVECMTIHGTAVWRKAGPVEFRQPLDVPRDRMSMRDVLAYLDVAATHDRVYGLYYGKVAGRADLSSDILHVYDIDSGEFLGVERLPVRAKHFARNDTLLAVLHNDPYPIIRVFRIMEEEPGAW